MEEISKPKYHGRKKSKFWIWLVIALAVFIIGLVLYLLLYRNGQSGEVVNAMDAIENALEEALK